MTNGLQNFFGEVVMHVGRFFMLYLLYRFVVSAVIPGLPVLGWAMGVMVYAVLAIVFTIDLKLGT